MKKFDDNYDKKRVNVREHIAHVKVTVKGCTLGLIGFGLFVGHLIRFDHYRRNLFIPLSGVPSD